MNVLKLIALIFGLMAVYMITWAWFSSLLSFAIRTYFTERFKYRFRVDATVEQILKDYPKA